MSSVTHRKPSHGHSFPIPTSTVTVSIPHIVCILQELFSVFSMKMLAIMHKTRGITNRYSVIFLPQHLVIIIKVIFMHCKQTSARCEVTTSEASPVYFLKEDASTHISADQHE